MRKLQLIHKTWSSLLLYLAFIVPLLSNNTYNVTNTCNVLAKPTLYQNTSPPFRLVIDAGHGGMDPGCIANNVQEKDIALNIALKLGSQLLSQHPDIEIIFTRTEDKFVNLKDRVGIANSVQADLFVSIHCNYYRDPKITGTETFVMGLHTADENLEVAKRENASIQMEQDFEENYDGYDPDSPMGHIMLSMYQNAHLSQSLELADYIEDQFSSRNNTISRGVKQAGFVVLKEALMPAVLIEAGFLSNPTEARYLSTHEGQDEIARNILNALSSYIQENSHAQENNMLAETTQPILIKQENNKSPYNSNAMLVHKLEKNNTLQESVNNEKNIPSIKYRVQIAASKNKPMAQKDTKWLHLESIDIEFKDGLYKYYTGHFLHMEEALNYKDKLIDDGFKGAFIVSN